METVDVKSSEYFDFNKENNEKYPNFEVGDHVKISKYKIHMLLVMWTVKKLLERFMKKNCKKQTKKKSKRI